MGLKAVFTESVLRSVGFFQVTLSRGRKSAAQIATMSATGIETGPRAEPPADFTADERIEWNRQINSLAAEHFPIETHPMLALYCRHIVRSRWIAGELSRMQNDPEQFDSHRYHALLKVEASQTIAIKVLATAMR